MVAIEAIPGETDFLELKDLVAGSRGRDQCIEKGDIDNGIWTAGMVMGLIHDIPSCDQLIKRMMREAQEAAKDRMKSLL